jgi:hypothetical protein
VITIANILLILGLLAGLMGVNAMLGRPRNYKNYSKQEIIHKVDSLMVEKVYVLENETD